MSIFKLYLWMWKVKKESDECKDVVSYFLLCSDNNSSQGNGIISWLWSGFCPYDIVRPEDGASTVQVVVAELDAVCAPPRPCAQ